MENNNRKTKREAALLVLVVFVLGVLLGAAGNHVWGERVGGDPRLGPNGRPSRNQIIDHFTHELELTPDQRTQLGAIVDDTRSKLDALYAPLDGEHNRIRLDGRQRIRAILTPEQQTKFDAFMQHLDEQRKKAEATH